MIKDNYMFKQMWDKLISLGLSNDDINIAMGLFYTAPDYKQRLALSASYDMPGTAEPLVELRNIWHAAGLPIFGPYTFMTDNGSAVAVTRYGVEVACKPTGVIGTTRHCTASDLLHNAFLGTIPAIHQKHSFGLAKSSNTMRLVSLGYVACEMIEGAGTYFNMPEDFIDVDIRSLCSGLDEFYQVITKDDSTPFTPDKYSKCFMDEFILRDDHVFCSEDYSKCFVIFNHNQEPLMALGVSGQDIDVLTCIKCFGPVIRRYHFDYPLLAQTCHFDEHYKFLLYALALLNGIHVGSMVKACDWLKPVTNVTGRRVTDWDGLEFD